MTLMNEGPCSQDFVNKVFKVSLTCSPSVWPYWVGRGGPPCGAHFKPTIHPSLFYHPST